MTSYFLGVDTGATKSHALICDAQGQAVGVGKGGPGNHESIGKAGFTQVLNAVTAAALEMAGISKTQIAGAGYGIAGYDWSEDEALMHDVIATLALNAPYAIMNDSGPALLAGSSNGWGVSIGSGTGVNGRGRDAQGRQARVTGNGSAFGEIGGGSELVRRAVVEISKAWSMRGPTTRLSEVFIDYTGAKDVEDLLAGLARGRYKLGAPVAPLVFQTANEGDPVAQGVVCWMGAGLGDVACGIIRQLDIAALAFDVVLSGSMFQGSPLMLESMQTEVWKLAPQARFVHLSAPPVVGAVMLGMEQAGLDYIPLRARIIDSGAAMLTDG
jgi:N-acetylglucosamine kinase-like BadF-type ATPase